MILYLGMFSERVRDERGGGQMSQHFYPTIDLEATGRNIRNLRMEKGLSIEDLQDYFDLTNPDRSTNGNPGNAFPPSTTSTP